MPSADWLEVRLLDEKTGSFDEIVANNVNIHIERMDNDLVWMGIYNPDRPDERQTVMFSVKGKKLIQTTELE